MPAEASDCAPVLRPSAPWDVQRLAPAACERREVRREAMRVVEGDAGSVALSIRQEVKLTVSRLMHAGPSETIAQVGEEAKGLVPPVVGAATCGVVARSARRRSWTAASMREPRK